GRSVRGTRIDNASGVKRAIAVLLALLAIPSLSEAARKPRHLRFMKLSATAYCNSGRTSSGVRTRPGVVAADPRVLPIGTVIRIPPNKRTYSVEDTGSGIKRRELDIYMTNCRAARKFGRRHVRVEIVR